MMRGDIDCAAVARWLEEGGTHAHPDAESLHTHVATCAVCAAGRDALAALETWLADAPALPVRFADAVMAQVALDTLIAVQPTASPPRAPRWRDAWRSPEVAAGFAAGLVVAGVLPLAASTAAAARGSDWQTVLARWAGLLAALTSPPAMVAGLVCIGTLLAVPVTRACYRWAAGLRG